MLYNKNKPQKSVVYVTPDYVIIIVSHVYALHASLDIPKAALPHSALIRLGLNMRVYLNTETMKTVRVSRHAKEMALLWALSKGLHVKVISRKG